MNSNLDTQTNIYQFSQWDLPDCKGKLKDVKSRYNGLCDIISNYILSFDLLGSKVDKNYLVNRITLKNLNADNFQNSHLMEVYTDAQKEKVLTSQIYPDNILSVVDQRALVIRDKRTNSVDSEILKRNMESLDSGKTVKLISVRQDEAGFQGHSMLVKKVEANNFIFFDPDWGEKRDLTLEDLSSEINTLLKCSDDVCFMDGVKFLKAFREIYPKKAA